MGKKVNYDHVGRVDVFKQRPPKKDDDGWIWGLAFIGFVLLLISSCS